jgi:F0F1-type ATP synthase assembly protein I
MVFMAGGWLLDDWLGSFPVLMVLGALLGATLSTVSIYRRLLVDQDTDEAAGREEER